MWKLSFDIYARIWSVIQLKSLMAINTNLNNFRIIINISNNSSWLVWLIFCMPHPLWKLDIFCKKKIRKYKYSNFTHRRAVILNLNLSCSYKSIILLYTQLFFYECFFIPFLIFHLKMSRFRIEIPLKANTTDQLFFKNPIPPKQVK